MQCDRQASPHNIDCEFSHKYFNIVSLFDTDFFYKDQRTTTSDYVVNN